MTEQQWRYAAERESPRSRKQPKYGQTEDAGTRLRPEKGDQAAAQASPESRRSSEGPSTRAFTVCCRRRASARRWPGPLREEPVPLGGPVLGAVRGYPVPA